MHELAVCAGLMGEVARVARDNGASRVSRVTLAIGPLSGVEPTLLRQAFTIARAGTLAETADLVIEDLPIRVACTACGAETGALPNRLVCGVCGAWRVRLMSGDEMLLKSLDLQCGSADEEGEAPCVPHAAAR